MTTDRRNVSLTADSRFEVLGLVSIAPPGPWWWHHEDFDEPYAVGAIFRCYEKGNDQELGYLLVADVSRDPDEPDISKCEEGGVRSIDRHLADGVRRVMASDGRRFKRWMASHLNHRKSGKALVTAYIAEDQGRDRQYVDLRMRVGSRNVVVGCCFDVSRAGDLAKPFFLAISDALPIWRQ